MSAEVLHYDVFLSHSAKDKAVVRPLAERLRQDGLKVWFDEWVLRPGDCIPAKIEAGLEHSRVLVLCMSAHAFGSDWAQLEAGTFRFRDPLNQERRFIPLRLDDAPIKCGAASAKAASKYTQAPATACALSTPVRRRDRWHERQIPPFAAPSTIPLSGRLLFPARRRKMRSTRNREPGLSTRCLSES